MESDGVLELYSRSIAKHGIRYRYSPFIGDGDSSSYNRVDNERPYGASCFVEKHECVNHVTKRMGTNLRSLVREYKGKKLSDGKCVSGKGRLTIARIDAIQNFYGRTIRNNKNNPVAMSKETWAILDHYSSTHEQPKHDNCPPGISSWCSFQRDVATGQSTHKPTKSPFSAAMVDVMKPLFSRLSDVTFLEKCKECSTQNANESFNSLVWSLSPKEKFNSPIETSVAVNLAVCLFNNGIEYTLTNLLQKADMVITNGMRAQWREMDEERIKQGDYAAQTYRKDQRRLRKRRIIKTQDAFQHIEGIQYQPQGFHTNDQSALQASASRPSKRGRRKKL